MTEEGGPPIDDLVAALLGSDSAAAASGSKVTTVNAPNPHANLAHSIDDTSTGVHKGDTGTKPATQHSAHLRPVFLGLNGRSCVLALCPNGKCHNLVPVDVPSSDSARSHAADVSILCERCMWSYPTGAFPEAFAELPACLSGVWSDTMAAASAEGESDGAHSIGEQLVQRASEAAEAAGWEEAFQTALESGRSYSKAEDDGAQRRSRAGRVKAGARMLLCHAVRTASIDVLALLTSVPTLPSNDAQAAKAAFAQWLRGGWFRFFLAEGGLELLLSVDDDAEDAAGQGSALFRALYKSLMRVFNHVRKLKVPGYHTGSFLAPLLQTVMQVPEYGSPSRVATAVSAIRGLKALEKTCSLFSSEKYAVAPLPGVADAPADHMHREGAGHLTAVAAPNLLGIGIRCCRKVLLAALLEVEGVLAKPLSAHHSIPPPTFVMACTALPSVDHHATVRMVLQAPSKSTSTLSTEAHGCDALLYGQRFWARGLEWAAVVRGPDSAGVITLVLRLLAAHTLGPQGVRVTATVGVLASGTSKRANATVVEAVACSFGKEVHTVGPLQGRMTSEQSSPGSSTTYEGCGAEVELRLSDVVVEGAGRRGVRGSEERESERAAVMRALIQRAPDPFVALPDGTTPLRAALDAGITPQLLRLCIPKDVRGALKQALACAAIDFRELLVLTRHVSSGVGKGESKAAMERLGDVDLGSVLGRPVLHAPGPAGAASVLKLLLPLVNDEEIEGTARAALEAGDWAALDLCLQSAPPTFAAASMGIHRVVEAGLPHLVRRMLELRCSATERVQDSGDTPLHIACKAMAATEQLEAMVAVLLQHGADASVVDSQGCSAASHLEQRGLQGILERHTRSTAAGPGTGVAFGVGLDGSGGDGADSAPHAQEPQHDTRQEDGHRRRGKRQGVGSKVLQERVDAVSKKIECFRSVASMASALLKQGHSDADADASRSSTKRTAPHTRSDVSEPSSEARVQQTATDDGAATVKEDSDQATEEADSGREEGRAGLETNDGKAKRDAKVDLKSLQVPVTLEGGGDVEWDLRFTKEFKEELFAMHSQPVLLRSMMENLRRLAAGEQGRTIMKQLKGTPKSLQIFETPCKTFNDGGRFLWQYAVDYSPRIRAYSDTIRLWRICLQHDDVPKGIEFIVNSHKRGRTSTMKKQLKPTGGGAFRHGQRRVPRTYTVCEGVDEEQLLRDDAIKFQSLAEMEEDGEFEEDDSVLLYTPPAIAEADSYNVLKFYALNDEVLKSVYANAMLAEVDSHRGEESVDRPEFPFIPDEREDRLISEELEQRSSSVLLVGRSGTGKTSIAIGRMFALYRQWHAHFEGAQVVGGESDAMQYNQVFVTANKVLRDQVRKSFQAMLHGSTRSGGGDVQSPVKYPPSLSDVSAGEFPLFLTQSEWLRMVDGTLPEPFFPRNADGSLVHSSEVVFHEEIGMLDSLPEEAEWLSDGSDSELDEDDRGERCDAGANPSGGPSGVPGAGKGGGKKAGRPRPEIDFGFFVERIWPKLAASNKNAAKHLSPSALFQEIHSFIKGSNAALDTSAGRLSREQYLKLGAKMAPNFRGLGTNERIEELPGDRTGHRDLVYNLFEAYEEERKALGAYDISDVVFYIWSALSSSPYSGPPIHSILVDETQDFTQAELRLLIHVCRDKNDMFFSGDTCQTIASGVGFRFEDLRSLFKAEQDLQQQQKSSVKGPSALPSVELSVVPVAVPKVSALTVNYRTHNGILGAAASVVDLLASFFPSTIDFLPRERGFFDGPKPILLTETDIGDAAVMILGGDRNTAKRIEFGAHQVILLRNQQAKAELPPDFEGCLAMTVLESKGLEFDDVFLVNFFADSKADQEWRVVLSFLAGCKDKTEAGEEQAALDAERSSTADREAAGMLRALEFSERAHQVLCEELKHLYTAVTRARVRVVIYDRDARKRAPFFYYLRRRQLVESLSFFSRDAADSPAPLAVKTSAEEWRRQGLNLRENGLYHLAAKCFSKSGDVSLQEECCGLALGKRAAELSGRERSETFWEAAEHFLRVGLWHEFDDSGDPETLSTKLSQGGLRTAVQNGVRAARCLFEAGYSDVAANLFMLLAQISNRTKDASRLASDAVRCYRSAGQFKTAIDALVRMGRIRSALRLLREEHKYDQAIAILHQHPQTSLPPELSADAFVKLSASVHAMSAKPGSEDAKTRRFLDLVARMSSDDQEVFLRRYGFRDVLVAKLVEQGNLSAAAKVLVEDGSSPYSLCLCLPHGKALEGAKMLQQRQDVSTAEIFLCGELFLSLAFSENSEDAVGYLGMALDTHRRLDSIYQGSAMGASSRETESRRVNALQMLQIELEIALRFQGADRTSKLQQVVASALELECKMAEGLARLELLYVDLCMALSKPRPSSGNLVLAVQDLLPELRAVLRSILAAPDRRGVPPRGRDGAEYIRFEHFFGLRREGGALCISRQRLALLRPFLEAGQHHEKGDNTVVVDALWFKSAVLKCVAGRLLEMLVLLFQLLSKLKHVMSESKEQLLADAIKAWIVEQGLRAVRLFHRSPAAADLAAMLPARTRKLIPPLPSPDELFTAARLRATCDAVEAALCPQVGLLCHPARYLTEAFPSRGRQWKQVERSCREVMRAHTASLVRRWWTQPPQQKSAHLLSRALALYPRIGHPGDALHLIRRLPEDGSAPWQPPLQEGYNAYVALHAAFGHHQQHRYLLEAVTNMRFLWLHVLESPPVDTWELIRAALTESIVALAFPPTILAGPSSASTQDQGPARSISLMPLCMARRLLASRRSPDQAGDPKSTLMAALDALGVVLNGAEAGKVIEGGGRPQRASSACGESQDAHGAGWAERTEGDPSISEMARGLVWAVLLNLLLSVSRGQRRSRWDCCWAAELQPVAAACLQLEPTTVPAQLVSIVSGSVPTAATASQLAGWVQSHGDTLVSVVAQGEQDVAIRPVPPEVLPVMDLHLQRGALACSGALGDELSQDVWEDLEAAHASSVDNREGAARALVEQYGEGWRCWLHYQVQLSPSKLVAWDSDKGGRVEAQLEAEARCARVLERFARFCRHRFALRRLLGDPAQQQTAPGGGGGVGDEEPARAVGGAAAVEDPYQRLSRYCMLVEQEVGTAATGLRRGLVDMSGPFLVMEESIGAQAYCLRMEEFGWFRGQYAAALCPVLCRADVATLELQRLSDSPLARMAPAVVVRIDDNLRRLAKAMAGVEKTLDAVDRGCEWGRESWSRLETCAEDLHTNVLVHAEWLVAALSANEEQLQELAVGSGGEDADAALLPVGARCTARHRAHDVWYRAKVVRHAAEGGYVVEFDGLDESEAVGQADVRLVLDGIDEGGDDATALEEDDDDAVGQAQRETTAVGRARQAASKSRRGDGAAGKSRGAGPGWVEGRVRRGHVRRFGDGGTGELRHR